MREDQLKQSALRQLSSLKTSYDRHLTWTPPTGLPISITFLADIHLGDSGTDIAAFERDLDLILKTPNAYIVWGGDLIDNHIKHLSAMVNQDMPPAAQWSWITEVLERTKHRTIAVVAGNHDNWTAALTGFSPLAWIADRLCLPYESDEIHLTIKYPRQSYEIGLRHKYRFNSTVNPANSVKQWYRHGDFLWDVGVVCHLHTATIEPFMGHGKMRWAVRPGSYQVASSYAIREGFHGVSPVSPGVVLLPDRRGLHAYLTVEDTVDALSAKTLYYGGPSHVYADKSGCREKSDAVEPRPRMRVRGRARVARVRAGGQSGAVPRPRGHKQTKQRDRRTRGTGDRNARTNGRADKPNRRRRGQQNRPVRKNRK